MHCGILDCFSLLINDILQHNKVCINQCDYFRKQGKQYRRKHLNTCLQAAQEAEGGSCHHPTGEHPGVECFVAQINKLLSHYGSSSRLGIHMQASMEMLVIEGGVSFQILSMPFSWYSKWLLAIIAKISYQI